MEKNLKALQTLGETLAGTLEKNKKNVKRSADALKRQLCTCSYDAERQVCSNKKNDIKGNYKCPYVHGEAKEKWIGRLVDLTENGTEKVKQLQRDINNRLAQLEKMLSREMETNKIDTYWFLDEQYEGQLEGLYAPENEWYDILVTRADKGRASIIYTGFVEDGEYTIPVGNIRCKIDKSSSTKPQEQIRVTLHYKDTIKKRLWNAEMTTDQLENEVRTASRILGFFNFEKWHLEYTDSAVWIEDDCDWMEAVYSLKDNCIELRIVETQTKAVYDTMQSKLKKNQSPMEKKYNQPITKMEKIEIGCRVRPIYQITTTTGKNMTYAGKISSSGFASPHHMLTTQLNTNAPLAIEGKFTNLMCMLDPRNSKKCDKIEPADYSRSCSLSWESDEEVDESSDSFEMKKTN